MRWHKSRKDQNAPDLQLAAGRSIQAWHFASCENKSLEFDTKAVSHCIPDQVSSVQVETSARQIKQERASAN